MSRLTSLSAEAVKQLQSPDADSTFIGLVTIYDSDEVTPIVFLCDNYISRISETNTDVIYGVVSRGQSYTFLPISLILPNEDQNGSPSRAQLLIKDVTRYVTPVIRELTFPPKIKIEIILSKTPDVVEIAYEELFITNFQYTSDQVTADISAVELEREPFPAYSVTPQFFPGMF